MGVWFVFLFFFFLIVALISLFDFFIFLILKVCWLADFHTVGCPSCAWHLGSVKPSGKLAAEGRVSCAHSRCSKLPPGHSHCKNRRTRQSLQFLTYIPSSWKLLRLPACCGGILQHINVRSCYFNTFNNDFQGKSSRSQENAWVKCCANCVSFDIN